MIVKTLKSKLEHALRLLYINSIAMYNDSILLVEYPKSGGTWLGQLISDYFDMPFPRNEFPVASKSVYHSHYLPKYNIHKKKKIVYLVRDGRDVIVSSYYHQLIWNEKNRLNPKDVKYHRKNVPFDDYENVKKNIAEFIKYSFEHKPSRIQQFTYMGNWYQYNVFWMQEMANSENVYMVKYEDLLENTFETMKKMLVNFFGVEHVDNGKLKAVVDRFSFEKQSNRRQGEEDKNSFLRKGIKGDWINYFDDESKELFKKHTKNLIVELGYETDQKW